MEPQLPPVGPAPERGPVVNREQAPIYNIPTPEMAPARPPLEHERGIEQSMSAAQGVAVPSAAVPVAPAPPIPVVQPTVAPDPATSSNPVSAANEDLIEKEWVAKAKQVVQSTHDDPYEQGKQVTKLMTDYVKKRYGKEVGKSEPEF